MVWLHLNYQLLVIRILFRDNLFIEFFVLLLIFLKLFLDLLRILRALLLALFLKDLTLLRVLFFNERARLTTLFLVGIEVVIVFLAFEPTLDIFALVDCIFTVLVSFLYLPEHKILRKSLPKHIKSKEINRMS